MYRMQPSGGPSRVGILAVSFKKMFAHKNLVWQLAKHKLREQYATTLLGSIWGVLQPLMTLFVFWFVFSYGFKADFQTKEIPYFLVLFAGLIPWMAFSDALFSGANAILSHQYLIKKTFFPLEILPVAQVISSIIIHLYLILFLIALLSFYNIFPTLYAFQVFYYLFAMIVFTLALSWALSALSVFYRDVSQTLSVIITLWFWITPIVWPVTNLSEKARSIIQLNPMFYIIEGYRKTFLHAEPFWQDVGQGLYFWTVCLLLLWLGLGFFNRVKYQFADAI